MRIIKQIKIYSNTMQNKDSKNWIKEQVENIEVLDKSQFADFIIILTTAPLS
jgi:hypothetical protein